MFMIRWQMDIAKAHGVAHLTFGDVAKARDLCNVMHGFVPSAILGNVDLSKFLWPVGNCKWQTKRNLCKRACVTVSHASSSGT